MRVIAGEAKGRILKSINNKITRPTLDRVKEAIFNILGSAVINGRGLDLFAGFGSLGLEAISRGAEEFIFVENNYRNVKIIKDNIKMCGFEERAQVIKEDVFRFLAGVEARYDLILMDPPYEKGFAQQALETIAEKKLLRDNGLVVVEHNSRNNLKIPSYLELIKKKEYGDTGVTFLKTKN